MSPTRFVHPVRLARALFIAAVCATLASSALADLGALAQRFASRAATGAPGHQTQVGISPRPSPTSAVPDKSGGAKGWLIQVGASLLGRNDRPGSTVTPIGKPGDRPGYKPGDVPSYKPGVGREQPNVHTPTSGTSPDTHGSPGYRPEVGSRPSDHPNTPTGPVTRPEVGTRPSDRPNTPTGPVNRPEVGTRPSDRPNTPTGPVDRPQVGTRPSDRPNTPTGPVNRPQVGTRPSDRPNTPTRPVNRPEVGTRPSDRPNTPPGPVNRPQVGTRPSARPDVGSRPSTNKPTSYRPGKPRVYTPARDSVPDYRPPASYKPPVLRSGRYYYPSRPSSRAYHYGYWVFDKPDPGFCRRSIYFDYGIFPYVQIARLFVTPYVVVEYRTTPVVIGGGYYLAARSTDALDATLSDIRTAWVDGRLDLIQNHVSSDQKIAVLLDGEYDYSIDPDDYIQMTSDAIDQVRTVSFTWETVKQRTDGEYTAFGKHVYRDSDENTQTVYVSYTLSRAGSDYTITEVGSSTSPLSTD